jgi:hypothetical protein
MYKQVNYTNRFLLVNERRHLRQVAIKQLIATISLSNICYTILFLKLYLQKI